MTGPAYDLLIFTVLPTRTEPTVEVVTLEVYGSNRKRRVFKLIIVVARCTEFPTLYSETDFVRLDPERSS